MKHLSTVFLLTAAAFGRDLVRIPATSFEAADEVTGVKLRVQVGPFLIAPTEVSQREYREVTGQSPSHYRGDDLPVENVSWWDAIRYCNLRSAREGLEPCYDLATGRCDRARNGYRLPTEAEWSAAAGAKPAANTARLGGRDTKRTAPLLDRVREGPARVASLAPNARGLYDMFGNVWEWCQDFYDSVISYAAAHNPSGPAQGVDRVVRGGSFATSTTSWSRNFRSSLDPSTRSRYTGFRVCRTAPAEAAPRTAESAWLDLFNQPPQGFESTTGGLSPVLGNAHNRDEWRARAAQLREKWQRLLGAPEVPAPPPAIRVVDTFHEPGYEGTLAYLQVEPDFWEKIYILKPLAAATRPLPVVIVPFYDVDPPAGKDMGGRRFTPPGVRSYAYLAAQQGFLAVAIRWWGESYAESYDEAVANLRLRHPRCTGLGKWVWDARRLVDYLATRADADPARMGIVGHSLGGKMALYAAALDERISVAVASEPGIGFSFSNYNDYWYFGEALAGAPAGTDQHELLALMAPRPFLLIGGDKYDTAKSWAYIHAARPAYALFGDPRRLGYLNHHTGHTPTPDAVTRMMEWLARFL